MIEVPAVKNPQRESDAELKNRKKQNYFYTSTAFSIYTSLVIYFSLMENLSVFSDFTSTDTSIPFNAYTHVNASVAL